MKLYRNNRNGTFTDVTRAAGLDVEMYGMGVAVGDVNNDGFPDIFITCVGQSRLFRNTGRGSFVDVYQGSLSVLPHEVHHVALGPPSADHQGWCPFGDWEAREGILEEHAYLGCPAPGD